MIEPFKLEKLTEEKLAEMIKNTWSGFPGEIGWSSLYSCFGIGPRSQNKMPSTINLFTYGRAQPISCWPKSQMATVAHTNIPRDGMGGLPKDWAQLVMRWRAVINEPLTPEVLDFLQSCSVRFIYSDKPYAQSTLLDLVHAPQPVGNVLMSELMSYQVDVQCDDMSAAGGLLRYLSSGHSRIPVMGTDVAEQVWAIHDELDAAIRETTDDTIKTLSATAVDLMRRRLARLAESVGGARQLTCWVYLEGPLHRCVI